MLNIAEERAKAREQAKALHAQLPHRSEADRTAAEHQTFETIWREKRGSIADELRASMLDEVTAEIAAAKSAEEAAAIHAKANAEFTRLMGDVE